MVDRISYPIDEMSVTSRSLTSFLNWQWQQHTSLFLNGHASYMALLQGIAEVIPEAAGKSGDLALALENYQRQYQQCYQALRELAKNIETAAQAMSSEDKQGANTFQQM